MNPMSDQQPNYPGFPVPDALDVPPATGWVIHEVRRARASEPLIWAWCQVTDQGPGYTQITYTLTDGVTQPDHTPTRPELGPVITRIFC